MENYLDLTKNNNFEKLSEAGNIILNGGLVLFPTETVYGLGANGLNENAVKKIYVAKGRSSDNPLILHISDYEMLNTIAQNISEIEYKLMHAFWPGPFTIILERTSIVPNIVTGGLNTVGVRMPSSKIANELIKYSTVPIAAPSANISGKPSGTNLDDISEELFSKVDYIINGGNCDIGLESTVVRVIDNIPHILRPGKITAEQIKDIAGDVIIDSHVLGKLENNQKVLSPGMKYRHYAPQAKCILVYSNDNAKMVNKINEILSEYSNPVVIACSENIDKYNITNKIDIGSQNHLEEISKNLFTDLRKVDKYNPDIVVIEGVSKSGIGLAIMNRLIRACEYNYIAV